MNQIVRNSRMLRVRAEERLKNFRRLFLICVGFICRRRIGQQRQRVKHLGLGILLIVRSNFVHGLLIASRSTTIFRRVVILVDLAECVDKFAFAVAASLALLSDYNFMLASRK